MPEWSASLAALSVSGLTTGATRPGQERKERLIDYIEMFYNSRRRRSYLGYVSSMEFESHAAVA